MQSCTSISICCIFTCVTVTTVKGFVARFFLISQVLKLAATKRTFDGHVGQLATSFHQCFFLITSEMPSYLVQQGF